MKYINETHQLIIEKIKEEGLTPVYPIMLTADQNDSSYTVSLNFSGTTIKIPKSSITKEDIREINAEGTQIILNNVWEAKF